MISRIADFFFAKSITMSTVLPGTQCETIGILVAVLAVILLALFLYWFSSAWCPARETFNGETGTPGPNPAVTYAMDPETNLWVATTRDPANVPATTVPRQCSPECPATQICNDGVCVAPPAGECLPPCEAGQGCVSGTCRPLLRAPICPTICSPERGCVDGRCPFYKECVDGWCLFRPPCDPPCKETQACVDKRCVWKDRLKSGEYLRPGEILKAGNYFFGFTFYPDTQSKVPGMVNVFRGSGYDDPNKKALTNWDCVCSPGDYYVMQQEDGNLVVYNGKPNPPNPGPARSAVWATGFAPGKPAEGGYVTVMQGDGNLCTYQVNAKGDPTGLASWCSGTAGK